jgi:hypothetical protein
LPARDGTANRRLPVAVVPAGGRLTMAKKSKKDKKKSKKKK